MYCERCGTLNPDDSKFCSGCGSPLIKVAPQPDAAPDADEQVAYYTQSEKDSENLGTQETRTQTPDAGDGNAQNIKPQQSPADPKKPLNKKLIGIITTAAAVVVVLVIIAVIILGDTEYVQNSSDTSAEDADEAIETEDTYVEEDTDSEDDEEKERLARYQAYQDKIEELQAEYGEAKETRLEVGDYIGSEFFLIEGLDYAQLVDIDGDGIEELVTAYSSLPTSDISFSDLAYEEFSLTEVIQVWEYSGGTLSCIYSCEGYDFNYNGVYSYRNSVLYTYADGEYYLYTGLSSGVTYGTDTEWSYFDYKLWGFDEGEFKVVKTFYNSYHVYGDEELYEIDGVECSKEDYNEEIERYYEESYRYCFSGYVDDTINTPVTEMLEYTLQEISDVLNGE